MQQSIVKNIDVHELKNLQDANSNICIIDVRENDEWQAQRIKGKVAHIPKDLIVEEIESIAPEKNKKIYLYCGKGMRSHWAASQLIAHGYTDVYSVAGGITSWIDAGYPIIEG